MTAATTTNDIAPTRSHRSALDPVAVVGMQTDEENSQLICHMLRKEQQLPSLQEGQKAQSQSHDCADIRL